MYSCCLLVTSVDPREFLKERLVALANLTFNISTDTKRLEKWEAEIACQHNRSLLTYDMSDSIMKYSHLFSRVSKVNWELYCVLVSVRSFLLKLLKSTWIIERCVDIFLDAVNIISYHGQTKALHFAYFWSYFGVFHKGRMIELFCRGKKVSICIINRRLFTIGLSIYKFRWNSEL